MSGRRKRKNVGITKHRKTEVEPANANLAEQALLTVFKQHLSSYINPGSTVVSALIQLPRTVVHR